MKLALSNYFTVGQPEAIWRCPKDEANSLAKSITGLIHHPEQIPQEQIYKDSTRRLVFWHQDDTKGKVVVKAFPLKKLRHRFKHKRYACNEAKNLITAARLGLPVPAVYGYGVYKSWGLVRWNAVMLEHFDRRTLGECLNDSVKESEKFALLQRAFPLFRSLFVSGCNHLDLKPDSILLDDKDSSNDILIDFQYVQFLNQSSPEVVATQAAHFAWEAQVRNQWVTEDLMIEWFVQLVDYLNLAQNDKLIAIFNQGRTRRLKKEEKIRIGNG